MDVISPKNSGIFPSLSARIYSELDNAGSENPTTGISKLSKRIDSHVPLNPVWPVIKTGPSRERSVSPSIFMVNYNQNE
jgi:hypothetical protein